ncbi:putative clathrin assembly protein At1g03050 [Prosopis cineraria]|uniref:putative clathrin assembly protein At1g03050 n=1 Tax=Prosopis cineraria TaxID=364024 RepID=UPI0024102F73|nr:putative clathrin assembly protein At1g03050 [Prosopis cineraria]
MTSKIWKEALGAVKDQTSIGLAKVGSTTSVADLDVAIVKATKHNETPADEKHIREILSLTSYSRSNISACISAISRRLSRTRSWTVALKTLVLIQRLLQEGDPAYEQEIFFATRRGTRLLNMSDFRDSSTANSWDFSAFVRMYALYLDERLEYKMQNKRGRRSSFGYEDEDEDVRDNRDRYIVTYRDRDIEKNRSESLGRSTPLQEMRTEAMFSKMQHLQLLLERFLACRPTGEAKNHRIVMVALYPILKESFLIYYDMTEILGIMIDRFEDLEVQDCSKVYDIFCRVGKQYDELDLFYAWNKSMGIARSSEFPDIERITSKKLEVMDDFIREKSDTAQSRRNAKHQEEKIEEPEKPEPPQEDMDAIKALPPPETIVEPVEEPKMEEPKVVQTEGDLLHLGDDDTVTREEHEDKLALALFDGAGPTTAGASGTTLALPWHAFEDGSDWETTLVESASKLSNQKPALAGGLDTLLLDGMYNQAATNAAIQGYNYGAGSASSMAQGSTGRPAMLALPAPPSDSSGWVNNADPFAASMAVAPPAYVQMSEMEKKQRLLMEEQLLWQQYARDGMQGHGMTRMQPSNYMGGYPTSFGNYYH